MKMFIFFLFELPEGEILVNKTQILSYTEEFL